jgi:hypothetical protein
MVFRLYVAGWTQRADGRLRDTTGNMFDSFASLIDWVDANKEWLFNGVGLIFLSLLGSAIVLIGKLERNDHSQKGHKNQPRAAKPLPYAKERPLHLCT